MHSSNVGDGLRSVDPMLVLCPKVQQGRCCCRYDPTEDDSPELRIRDLSFALKKLSVMKCQMRKWQLERLQLESQTRSLKATLRSYGVDINEEVKTDPLIAHFRNENLKLQKLKNDLEDQVRDLKQTLDEHRSNDNNSFDDADKFKKKILSIQQNHMNEKKRLRELITDLQLRLQEKKDENFCTALNRLYAKLGDLMKGGRKDDHQVSCALEKSIETLVELSKSYDELREENGSLLLKVETLKKEEKKNREDEAINKRDSEGDAKKISNLYKRINMCEGLASEMQSQLRAKDHIIIDLQNSLTSKNSKKKVSNATNNKVDEQMFKERNSILNNLVKALKERLKKIRNELKEEKCANECFKKDIENLSNENKELQNKNISMIEYIENMKKNTDELNFNSTELTAELESFKLDSVELNKCIDKLGKEIDTITKEKATLINSLERAQHNGDMTNKELDTCRYHLSKVQSALANVNADKEKLEREVGDFKWQLNKLRKDLEVELSVRNDLPQKFDSKKVVTNSLNPTCSFIGEISETKKDNCTIEESKTLMSIELKNCKNEMEALYTENKQLRSHLEKLQTDTEQMKNKSKNMWKQSIIMKNEIKKLHKLRSDLIKSGNSKGDSENKSQKLQSEKDNTATLFISASEVLKSQITGQIEAVDSIRMFIEYAEGNITYKPESLPESFLNPCDRKDWTIPQINQLFDSSQELSETIYKAEQEIRFLGELRKKQKKEAKQHLLTINSKPTVNFH